MTKQLIFAVQALLVAGWCWGFWMLCKIFGLLKDPPSPEPRYEPNPYVHLTREDYVELEDGDALRRILKGGKA